MISWNIIQFAYIATWCISPAYITLCSVELCVLLHMWLQFVRKKKKSTQKPLTDRRSIALYRLDYLPLDIPLSAFLHSVVDATVVRAHLNLNDGNGCPYWRHREYRMYGLPASPKCGGHESLPSIAFISTGVRRSVASWSWCCMIGDGMRVAAVGDAADAGESADCRRFNAADRPFNEWGKRCGANDGKLGKPANAPSGGNRNGFGGCWPALGGKRGSPPFSKPDAANGFISGKLFFNASKLNGKRCESAYKRARNSVCKRLAVVGDWLRSSPLSDDVDNSLRCKFKLELWRSRLRLDGKAALQPSMVHLCDNFKWSIW